MTLASILTATPGCRCLRIGGRGGGRERTSPELWPCSSSVGTAHNIIFPPGICLRSMPLEIRSWNIFHLRPHSNFNYADDPTRFDLHQLEIPEAAYDFAMVNQTLEHVYNPFVSLENIRQYLAPGAYIYANAPTINIAHSTPFHFYTGFTPTGFACLFRSAGFEVLEIGQWGNQDYLNRLFKTQAWPDFRQLRSCAGDFNTPVIVWALARKD